MRSSGQHGDGGKTRCVVAGGTIVCLFGCFECSWGSRVAGECRFHPQSFCSQILHPRRLLIVELIDLLNNLNGVLLARMVKIGRCILLLLELNDEVGGNACCFFDRRFQ